MFFDLAVARHGLRDFGGWILIPIMLAAVTDENAAQAFNLYDQIAMFHAS